MPLYYPELKQPMAFNRMLPGCVGYVCPNGVIVMYGPKPKDPVLEEMVDRAMKATRAEWENRDNPIFQQAKRQTEHAKAVALHVKKFKALPVYVPRPQSAPPKTTGGKPKKFGLCPICEERRQLTVHHLTPKQVQKLFPRSVRANSEYSAKVCRPCHSLVHELFTNEELASTVWESVVTAVKEHKTSKGNFASK